MHRIIVVEIKKLFSSKILWLIIAGAILPGIITCLTLMGIKNLEWKDFLHASMIVFNVQAILTFSSFSSYLWAREYEENMIDIVLCYPFPKYYHLLSKLFVMFFIISCTTFLFVLANGISGMVLVSKPIPIDTLTAFLKVVFFMISMHFMLLPFTFLITIITKNILPGVLLGVIVLILFSVFQHTNFMQYIPFCIPVILADNLFGFHEIILSSYSNLWYILLATFTVSLVVCFGVLKRKWELG